MKKFFFLLSAFLLVNINLMAERVTETEAEAIAQHFMNPLTPAKSPRRLAPARTTSPRRMVLRADNSTDNAYYIYDNANGEGWVIVAANDVVRPVLAFSETGHFRTEGMPDNVRSWLNRYTRAIRQMEARGIQADDATRAEWNALRNGRRAPEAATAVVGPLIKTQWAQSEPYNNLCPGTGVADYGSSKAVAGCVAISMAQVMNYWQWPEKGTGSHSYTPLDPNEPYVNDEPNYSKRYGEQYADFGNTTYDWDNMLDYYDKNATAKQEKAVSTLVYHCGVAVEMRYGSKDDGGSGAITINYGFDQIDWWPCSQNALTAYFGYNKKSIVSYVRNGLADDDYEYYSRWTDSQWTKMLKDELDKNRPILYDGQGEDGGHSFICDGYSTGNYFHFNWGWGGYCDGDFLLSELNNVKDENDSEGEGIGAGGYDFSEDQSVIIGIEPDKNGGQEELKSVHIDCGENFIWTYYTADNDWYIAGNNDDYQVTLDVYSSNQSSPAGSYVNTSDFYLQYTNIYDGEGNLLTAVNTAYASIYEENGRLAVYAVLIGEDNIIYEVSMNREIPTPKRLFSLNASNVDIYYDETNQRYIINASYEDDAVQLQIYNSDYTGTYPVGEQMAVYVTGDGGDVWNRAYSGYASINQTEDRITIAGSVLGYNSVQYDLYLTNYSQEDITTYRFEYSTPGGGIVTCDKSAGIYEEGTQFALTATPETGWNFDYWDVNGRTYYTSSLTIDLYENTIAIAYFSTSKTFKVTVTAGYGGSVHPAMEEKLYTGGSRIKISAEANDEYKFVEWAPDGVTDEMREVIITQDTIFKAKFAEIEYYTLKVKVEPEGAGTVYFNNQEIESMRKTYAEGRSVTLTAVAYDGYVFDHYEDGASDIDTEEYRVKMTRNKTVTAFFKKNQAIETVSGEGQDTGQKLFKDGQLFILRGGHIYTVIGQKVR